MVLIVILYKNAMMIFRKFNYLVFIFPHFLVSCNAQETNNNKEHLPYVPQIIQSIDTSPGWIQTGQKLMLTGNIYLPDGKSPAKDVIIYYYHTNTEGRYLHKPGQKRSMAPNELGQTHGYIRGWVKTDSLGRYAIYTVRPGTYPTRDFPAHLHATITEPGNKKEYYIDDFVFDDDKLLTSAYRKKMENRGGTGTVRLVKKEDVFVGERNIILGLNIPNYADKGKDVIVSGRNAGEDILSFTPFHAWGADKGGKACPICKYGWYHGILYFVGNNPVWDEVYTWLSFLDKESEKREKYLKVYFIYGNSENYSKQQREKELERIGEKLKLAHVALTFVPSFSDEESEVNMNKIDQYVENTFLIYKRSRIIDKYTNMKPVEENFRRISATLDETINEYFYLTK